jgi:hypothetical protein
VAQSVWTGGSRHTGLAAPPHRNIQSRYKMSFVFILMIHLYTCIFYQLNFP